MEKKKIFYKFFLYSTITFGVSIAIAFGIFDGIIEGIVRGIFSGLFFGVFITIICVRKHIRSVDNICKGERDNKYSTKQFEEMILNRNNNEQKGYLDKIKSFSNWKIVSSTNKMIIIKTKMTWESFGEKITIKIHEIAKNNIRITIESKPVFPITIIDYGKNLSNVLCVESLFKS